MKQTIKLLGSKKQIILYGPPGTGKTYNTRDITVRLLLGKVDNIDYEEDVLIEETKNTNSGLSEVFKKWKSYNGSNKDGTTVRSY